MVVLKPDDIKDKMVFPMAQVTYNFIQTFTLSIVYSWDFQPIFERLKI